MTKIIKFDDPVVLVGGADIDAGLLKCWSHLPLVVADGGADHLRDSDLLPQVVLGDIDSLTDPDYWRSVTRVVEITEQDTTDFEKCLYSVDAPFFVALGFLGGRLDHTLASLHVMQKVHQHQKVLLVGEMDVLFVSSESVKLQLPLHTRVSVYPLSRVRFARSDGLRYSLDGLTMQQGQMIGTSNVSCKESVEIDIASDDGCFALILPVAQLLPAIKGLGAQVPEI